MHSSHAASRGELCKGSIRTHKNYFGTHFSPIFFLILPLYLTSSTPETLFAISIMGLCFVGVVIYLIAQHILNKPLLATSIALLYFFSTPFSNLASMGFRESIFTLPFFALAILFYLRRSFWPMLISLIFAALCKEDVPLIMTGFALWAWVDGRERSWRWTPLIIGLSYFLVIFSCLMPWINASTTSGGTGFESYNYLGKNLKEVSSSFFYKAPEVWKHLTRTHIFVFWRDLLNPLLFLLLLSPFYIFIPFTQYAIMFLSDFQWYARTDYWYFAPTYPFIMTAAAFGLAKICRCCDTLSLKRTIIQSIIIIIVLCFSLTGKGMKNLLYNAGKSDVAFPSYLTELVNSVPANASLTAQTDLIFYFYKRDKLYLPYKIQDTDYVLLNFQGDSFLLSSEDFVKDIKAMLISGKYRLVRKVDKYYLLKRVDKAPVYEDLIEELRKRK